jgi:hypothetical protein
MTWCWRTGAFGVVAAGLVLVAGCTAGAESDSSSALPLSSTSSAPSSTSTGQSDASSTCGYLYEWVDNFRFPLQPDPHAAYTYVVPKITTSSVGFEITGSFPYAAWTEWMVYTGLGDKAQPYSVVKDSAITPEAGSVNPFVPGNRVLAAEREFRLLVVPDGTDSSQLAESLQGVPVSNILSSPTSGRSFVLANRVYNAFPGYNQGGAAGPTNTPFPTVRAVDLETGAGVDCASLNLVPDPLPPTDMPSGDAAASARAIALNDGSRLGAGPGAGASGTGAEYAPALDPSLIEFTRPPLLPGADVSSVPPADDCAGYLGAATSTDELGLIRIPEVPTWFDTTRLDEDSEFVQEETTYVSLTQYGASVSTYAPGKPTSGSIGNQEILLDDSGGATIAVWPRSLTKSQQHQVFALAKRQGWALLRGGAAGKVTTANLFLRMKGTSPSYQGGFVPTSDRPGVPCYFDDHPSGTSWAQVTGDKYVASASSIGGAAPQGVNCGLKAYLDGSCLATLKSYIAATGGSYRS